MGWWSDRWNDVTSTVSAVSNVVTTARDAVVEAVVETVEDVAEAVVEEVVERYEVASEAFDNALASTTQAISEGYEAAMVWTADNVFADDTWVGKSMNWAADAGDKLSNMYDYMIENPERAFATIGEGLEEGIGYVLGTPGYIVDLVAEGGDWAYSSMTGSERSEGFGLGWGNAIATGVDKGFDHAQAGINYSINNAILGIDTTYAEALDEADVKVLNEEEALLKGITIGAMEVTLLVATGGGSGVARAGAWTARIAGKADDVVRLTNTGTRISNAGARVGNTLSRGAQNAARPFQAAASIPGVAPAMKYAVIPGGLFYLNVNNELSQLRVTQLQDRLEDARQDMTNTSVTEFKDKEAFVRDLADRCTDEINQIVTEFNSGRVPDARRDLLIGRIDEIEALSDLIDEYRNPDTTGVRRDEIFEHLQERSQTLHTETSQDADGISTERPDGAGELSTQNFNPKADGTEPVLQDQPETPAADNNQIEIVKP